MLSLLKKYIFYYVDYSFCIMTALSIFGFSLQGVLYNILVLYLLISNIYLMFIVAFWLLSDNRSMFVLLLDSVRDKSAYVRVW